MTGFGTKGTLKLISVDDFYTLKDCLDKGFRVSCVFPGRILIRNNGEKVYESLLYL
ncbi:MAG: hypothetical protein BAJALOKI1v1_640016 [Promethearchaeota archaeon]|nr:MAG: hypothetical protein BAJALOKI1v1_640016 [Candidatus Lokiarchaeota archaeon]